EPRPPRRGYRNSQLNSRWLESLDYRWHRIAVNHAGAVAEADGAVRLVVAAGDPGVANGLDTAGHVRGTMCLRWVGAETHPDPATRVVRLDALRAGAGRATARDGDDDDGAACARASRS